MLISLPVLPIILLSVNCVSGVTLHRNKRVPQDNKEIEITHPFNHPPAAESYIPVTVIYDDEEDINVVSKSAQRDESVIEEEKTEKTSPDDESRVINKERAKIAPKALFANHPPSVEHYDPIAAIVDNDNKKEIQVKYIPETKEGIDEKDISPKSDEVSDTEIPDKADSVIKPKGRSIDLEIDSTSIRPLRKHSHRRRVHKVNKAKVDGSQNTSSKPEYTESTGSPKEVTSSKVEDSHHNIDQSTKFPRRMGSRGPIVPIVDSENYVFAFNGDYHYRYEGGDGTKAFEQGELKTGEDGSSGTGVVGGYSYKDKDGNDFSLSYTADENGYRPVGAHLPTPPPIPIAIQRALALLATKTTPETITESVNKSY